MAGLPRPLDPLLTNVSCHSAIECVYNFPNHHFFISAFSYSYGKEVDVLTFRRVLDYYYYVNKVSRQTRDYKRRIYSETQTS